MRLTIGIDSTLALLALKSASLVTADALKTAFEGMFPHEPGLQVDDVGGVLNIDCDNVSILVTPEPDPIPWGFLEEPCARSPFWPEATDEMRRQSAHLVVFGKHKNGDGLAECMAVTRVTAALLTCSDPVGVYWNSAPLVVPTDMFRDMAREMTRERLPLYLWIDFCAGRDEAGLVQGYTNGLSSMGHMELEIVDADREPSDVAGILYEVAHYLLDFSPDLLDGYTIGIGNNEQVSIRHIDSVFGHSGKVIQLLV